MRRAPLPLLLLLVLAVLAGCGRESTPASSDEPAAASPIPGVAEDDDDEAPDLGSAGFATKNTTRVGGRDEAADAAAVARAVFPSSRSGGPSGNRAKAVTLVDGRDWRVATAAAVLMADPVEAPVLLADGPGELPDATEAALEALAPTGNRQAGGAQVVRVGDVPRPEGLRTTDLRGRDPFAVARAIDAFMSAARAEASRAVIVVSADAPEYAAPAAGYAAKTGDPILFVRRDSVPADTRAAIRSHQDPRIYVLGPSKVVSPKVTRELRRLGRVTRVGGRDPIANAVEFAAFTDGQFGWDIERPGQGFVFARTDRPTDAAAAAALSSSGKHGPLLLLDSADRLPPAVEQYLLDVRPGYRGGDPADAVYNHGWVIGDGEAISEALQARIDELLEAQPEDVRR